MPNVTIRCTTECRVMNPDTGLEEHYEDEVAPANLYEVEIERGRDLMATGNFAVAPPGAVAHTSYVPVDVEEVPGAPAELPPFRFPGEPAEGAGGF